MRQSQLESCRPPVTCIRACIFRTCTCLPGRRIHTCMFLHLTCSTLPAPCTAQLRRIPRGPYALLGTLNIIIDALASAMPHPQPFQHRFCIDPAISSAANPDPYIPHGLHAGPAAEIHSVYFRCTFRCYIVALRRVDHQVWVDLLNATSDSVEHLNCWDQIIFSSPVSILTYLIPGCCLRSGHLPSLAVPIRLEKAPLCHRAESC